MACMLSLAEWFLTPLQSVPFAPHSASFWKDQADGSLLNSQCAIAASCERLADPLSPGLHAHGFEQPRQRKRVLGHKGEDVGLAFGLEYDHRANRSLVIRSEQRAADFHPRAKTVQIGKMRRTVLHALVKAMRLIDAGGDKQHKVASGLSSDTRAGRKSKSLLHSSPLCGRPSSAPTAPATSSEPSRRASTQLAIGMSTPRARANSVKAAAVKAPSTSRLSDASLTLSPRPSATPKEKFRDCADEQVRTRSPSPERPISVTGLAPRASPNRRSSAKPRATSAAPALAPKPRPAATPQAIASTFLAAPPISTPRTSLE